MNDNLPFNLRAIDLSWRECVQRGLAKVDSSYLHHLAQSNEWLPGRNNIFNAFSLPLNKVQYVLFGESPYPRKESANGFAFWDASVNELWSPTGLSKKVNRATSLRNLIKMLLTAENLLNPAHCGQEDIAKIDKTHLIQTNDELFNNLLKQGFLLLNATPVLQPGGLPQKDAKAWFPFVEELLMCLLEKKPTVKILLLGQIAKTIDKVIAHLPVEKLYAEHPYNYSFITNEKVITTFKPLHLLRKK